MAVLTVKKYKYIKDENGNKIKVEKTKQEWDRETKKGTAIYYFSERYEVNGKRKQYKSSLYDKKREAEADRGLFLNDPVKYIQEHSKRAKNSKNFIIISSTNNEEKKLNEYFQEFLDYHLSFVREGSVYNYQKIWNKHLKEFFGDLFPRQLELYIIRNWHTYANKKINEKKHKLYATQTKNTWHTVLSDFLEYLKMDGKIEYNYAKTVGVFKNTKLNSNAKQEIRYQTEEEFNLFMTIVDDEFWYAFFNFLFWHGCRKGEQRAIRIKNISLEKDAIKFEETFARSKNGGEIIGPIKNGKERIIYLAKQSKPYIEKLINFYKSMPNYSDEWFLFGGPFAIYKNRIEDKLKFYYNKLEKLYPNKKVNRLSHHEFGRHSHASHLLEEGLKKNIPLEELYGIIAQRLGDTIDVVKKTYAHPYEGANRDKSRNILN